MGSAANEQSDEDLMRGYQEGNASSLRVLFDRYSPKLASLARRMGLSESDAADVVQQTFLQVHRARVDYRPGYRFVGWIFAIARNEVLALLRKRKLPKETLSKTSEDGAEEEKFSSSLPNSLEQYLSEESSEVVRREVASLSTHLRLVMEMRFFDELSFAEIACALGIEEGTAKVRAHRACEQLRSKLRSLRLSSSESNAPGLPETQAVLGSKIR